MQQLIQTLSFGVQNSNLELLIYEEMERLEPEILNVWHLIQCLQTVLELLNVEDGDSFQIDISRNAILALAPGLDTRNVKLAQSVLGQLASHVVPRSVEWLFKRKQSWILDLEEVVQKEPCPLVNLSRSQLHIFRLVLCNCRL